MPRKKKKQSSKGTSKFASGESNAKDKARNDHVRLSKPPPRTAHYDYKKKVQKSAAECTNETATSKVYQWTEDSGKDKVKVVRKEIPKAGCEAMPENEWSSSNGRAGAKVDKKKFNPNYDEIFGKKKLGAAVGKFKKFKKTY